MIPTNIAHAAKRIMKENIASRTSAEERSKDGRDAEADGEVTIVEVRTAKECQESSSV